MSPRFARLRLGFALGCVVAPLLSGLVSARQDENPRSGRRSAPLVYVAEVDALIHPVTAQFVAQTIERADADDASLVVLVLRTPGGLVDSTRTINTSIIESATPVVVYVGPSGTRAASAGFLITIAADIAAMAPGTHIGAAHPVSGTGEAMDDTMAEKTVSDVAAYARSLAGQRGRNVELAENAVRESQSFTETEALNADPPLIDLVADDVDDLLVQLDGRSVTRWDGAVAVLETAGATVEEVHLNWRQELLSAIAHPQVSVLLFSLGTLGLTIELWNPGGIVPGIVGGVCLLLAFFAFQILPINYVGLLLIVFGLLLLAAEMMTATYGVLAVGGIVAMMFGAVMLVDSPAPELQLGWPFITSTMLALALITGGLARLGVRSAFAPPVTGDSGMVESFGHAMSPIAAGGTGRVSTHGEIWTATSDQEIQKGDSVQVVAVHGLQLVVRPAPTAGLIQSTHLSGGSRS